jgi:hypothetical protein
MRSHAGMLGSRQSALRAPYRRSLCRSWCCRLRRPHQDGGPRSRPRRSLPARRRQPDHLPAKRELSADHELINGIGVAPDYYVPLTAQDLSTGQDPDITKALTLLAG